MFHLATQLEEMVCQFIVIQIIVLSSPSGIRRIFHLLENCQNCDLIAY